jgi:nucleotide-binding universal stress UspA family protein
MTVLVSYIPTSEGFVALDQAITEATLRGLELVVVNVAVGQNFADPTFADEKDLDAVRSRISEAGLSYEIRQVTGALDVAEAVLLIAEEHHASLIVVGLRRRSALGKLLLGSNAQQIILSARCPVLSIRPTD